MRHVTRMPFDLAPTSRPVAAAVQNAIDEAMVGAYPLLRDALTPFGLSPYDILVPVYHQVIYEDEAPIYARMMRAHTIERTAA